MKNNTLRTVTKSGDKTAGGVSELVSGHDGTPSKIDQREFELGPGHAAVALTRREDEVMRAMAKGSLNKEIADELGISPSTVHKHQQSIFRKLHVGNRTEATLRWMLEGEMSSAN
jgi:DNA-binding NarL/FixJ family response regulator